MGCGWTKRCGIAAVGGRFPLQDHRRTSPVHQLCTHSRWAVRCYPITEFSLTSQRKILKNERHFTEIMKELMTSLYQVESHIHYKVSREFWQIWHFKLYLWHFHDTGSYTEKGIPFIHSNYYLGYSTFDFMQELCTFHYFWSLLIEFSFFPISKSILKYFNMKCIIPKYTTYIHIVLKYTYVVL